MRYTGYDLRDQVNSHISKLFTTYDEYDAKRQTMKTLGVSLGTNSLSALEAFKAAYEIQVQKAIDSLNDSINSVTGYRVSFSDLSMAFFPETTTYSDTIRTLWVRRDMVSIDRALALSESFPFETVADELQQIADQADTIACRKAAYTLARRLGLSQFTDHQHRASFKSGGMVSNLSMRVDHKTVLETVDSKTVRVTMNCYFRHDAHSFMELADALRCLSAYCDVPQVLNGIESMETIIDKDAGVLEPHAKVGNSHCQIIAYKKMIKLKLSPELSATLIAFLMTHLQQDQLIDLTNLRAAA